MISDPASITADVSNIEGVKLKAMLYTHTNTTVSVGIAIGSGPVALKKDFRINEIKKEIHSVSIVGFNINEGIIIQIIAGSFADDTMEIIEESLILTNKEIGLLTSDIALKLLVE